MSGRDDRARRRLRKANPLVPEEAPSPISLKGEALFHRIVQSPQSEPKQPFWRRRGFVILVPAVLVACAAGYALISNLSDPLTVVCFQEPALNSHRASVSPQGDDPVSACRPLWAPGGEFNPGGSPAPPLTACVLPSGGAGVFPRVPEGDTCAALGLAPASSQDLDTEQQAIQAVQEELSARFLDVCLNEERAIDLVTESLRRHGLSQWRVAPAAAFTDDRPCATLAFDVPSRTVLLVPASGGH